MEIIKYSDFINESMKNITLLDKITKYISRRYKNTNNELMLILYYIGKIIKFDRFLFVSKIEMSEEKKDVKHIFIVGKNSKYYDGTGFYTKNEIIEKFHISKFSYNDYTFYGNLEDVKKCIDVKKIELHPKIEAELKTILEKIKG